MWLLFFFKQKTAYEMRISDWSSDVCSSDLSRDIASSVFLLLHSLSHHVMHGISRFSGLDLGSMSEAIFPADLAFLVHRRGMTEEIGRASCRERVCQYV